MGEVYRAEETRLRSAASPSAAFGPAALGSFLSRPPPPPVEEEAEHASRPNDAPVAAIQDLIEESTARSFWSWHWFPEAQNLRQRLLEPRA